MSALASIIPSGATYGLPNEFEAGLDSVDCRTVRRSVGLHAPQDPNHIRRRLNFLHSREDFPSSRPGDREASCFRSGRPRARRCEYIRPGVEHRQIIAAARIGNRQDQWLGRQIEKGRRVEGIDVGANNVLERRRRKNWGMGELIYGRGYSERRLDVGGPFFDFST